MSIPLFQERQHLRQPLLWIFLIGITFFVIFSVAMSVYDTQAHSVAQWSLFAVSSLFSLGVILFVYICRLDVRVSARGLETRFYPFEYSYRITPWDEITSYKALSLKPSLLRGLGLRYWSGTKAYIMNGNDGLEFTRRNGKKLFVGSVETTRFIAAVNFFKQDLR